MMSEKEFTDMAAELRVAAVRSAAAAGIGVEGRRRCGPRHNAEAVDAARQYFLCPSCPWTGCGGCPQQGARHAAPISHGIADDGSDCCPTLVGCRCRYRGRGDRCMAAAQTPGSAAHAASGVAAATDRTEGQCRYSCHTRHQAGLGGHAALKGTQTAARRYQKT